MSRAIGIPLHLDIPSRAPVYTEATLPAPSLLGKFALVSDGTRNFKIDTGSDYQDLGGEVFNLKFLGAKGDMKTFTGDATGTAVVGTGFTATAAGKSIVIPGAGAAGADYHGTISVFNSATSLTI